MAIYKSKKPTKDGRQYFFRIKYKDIMGISHDYTSQKYKNAKEARNEEALYRIKINNQETITSSLTIEQAYLELINHKAPNIKKQTIVKNDNLFKYLSPIINKKINDIDLNVYNALIEHLKKMDVSIDYKNKILGLFKQIIIYSSRYHNTSDSIIKFIEKFKNIGEIKKEMEFFTYEEYLKFISVIPDLEWRTFFSVLYFMGIRKGECQSLTWEDIKFDKGEMRINKTLTTKIKGETYSISSPKTKNSIRTLPIPKNVLESLKTMKNNAKQYKDFKENRVSSHFGNIDLITKGKCTFANLNELFPAFIGDSLKEAIDYFDSKIKGFSADDTILLGVESRTSSPVRIERDNNGVSNILGIYPCGEGAGYAGGITSSAMDGIKIAEEIAKKYSSHEK